MAPWPRSLDRLRTQCKEEADEAGVSALTQSSKDAVAVDPTHHHVVMENPRVRVVEVLAAPGDKSPMHTHPPLVAVSLGKARLRMTTPDGKISIFDLHPGQVLWMENVEHSWCWAACLLGSPKWSEL